MSFSLENGYIPQTINQIMSQFRIGINEQFSTNYTPQSFVGTNHYKYFYPIAQRIQKSEVKTSEIFSYLQQYIILTNQRIQRPVATPPGIIEAFDRIGYRASVKPPEIGDAGQLFVCVQVDGYEHAQIVIGNLTFIAVEPGLEGNSITVALITGETAGSETVSVVGTDIEIGIEGGVSTANQIRDAIENDDDASKLIRVVVESGEGSTAQAAEPITSLMDGTGDGYQDEKDLLAETIKNSIAGGIISQGDQIKTIVLTNGQSFDFKYTLPTKIAPDIRLTLTLSQNNQFLIQSPDFVRALLFQNILERYKLGQNFEPQKYFSISDAPWTSDILLEYDIGSGFTAAVFQTNFDQLFDIKLENIILVEQ